jgi:hypothetical protein
MYLAWVRITPCTNRHFGPASPPPELSGKALGGVFLSTPAAIAWDGARIDLFGMGTDRAMYHRTWNGQTRTPDWDRLGGILTSEASAVSWGPNHLDVFALGSDFTLRHRAYDGTNWLTSGWQNLGGSLGSPPVSVACGANRLDIFAIANDGTLIHKWWDGDIWNDWKTLGPSTPNATFVSTPAAVSWGPERFDVFVIGKRRDFVSLLVCEWCMGPTGSSRRRYNLCACCDRHRTQHDSLDQAERERSLVSRDLEWHAMDAAGLGDCPWRLRRRRSHHPNALPLFS